MLGGGLRSGDKERHSTEKKQTSKQQSLGFWWKKKPSHKVFMQKLMLKKVSAGLLDQFRMPKIFQSYRLLYKNCCWSLCVYTELKNNFFNLLTALKKTPNSYIW